MEAENLKKVSVIIPTYNRAHIIAKTIPSYLQKNVGEIIVIDDCSTDRTLEVLTKMKKELPELRILRNRENRKQTYSKNRGIRAARYPYIYFGDDDSFITEKTIATLLKYAEQLPGSLISARPLYLGEDGQARHLDQFIRMTEKHNADQGYPFLNLNCMVSDTSVYYTRLTRADIVPACFLIASVDARKLRFDDHFRMSNAFREESDYVMQAREAGLECYFAPNAYQINYPRPSINRKDLRKGFLYEWGCLFNTKKFLDKHYDFMNSKQMVHSSKNMILARYICFEIRRNIKIYAKQHGIEIKEEAGPFRRKWGRGNI